MTLGLKNDKLLVGFLVITRRETNDEVNEVVVVVVVVVGETQVQPLFSVIWPRRGKSLKEKRL
ncbi:hypothetical protein E2C01_054022 [Portunus trituberculatus]|uniref:Uncharacterized protein n=1 Tax=Portunus trituberculatus TaxID=210409 RepID=A0A5B7GSL7_PORTR|nr:hypothetical protein [Portunus trituberculatus]